MEKKKCISAELKVKSKDGLRFKICILLDILKSNAQNPSLVEEKSAFTAE